MTIRELWNGSIRSAQTNTALCHLNDLLQRNHEKLCRDLTHEQKVILEKYQDHYAEYAELLAEEAFFEGFCLAARLLTEALGTI